MNKLKIITDLFPDVQPITPDDIQRLEKKGLLVKKHVEIQTGPQAGHKQTIKSGGNVIGQRGLFSALNLAKITQKDARQMLIIEAQREGGSRNGHVLKLANLAFFDEKMEAIRKAEAFGEGVVQ